MIGEVAHVTFIDGKFDNVSIVEGTVRRVAEDTIRDVVERCGHPTRLVSISYPIDDRSSWVRAEYEGTVTLSNGDSADWRHVFTTVREPWRMLPIVSGDRGRVEG